ncbi:MAG: hypothetical protein DRI34_07930 [Deltaproteobacteria bacterium]|nr:MAG: hypothetical protein DRI34_07930 [Deltaproteobacteria bacterium]
MPRLQVPLPLGVVFLCLALPAAAQEKFSLTLFHFNIQYVAGGLQGFPSGESNDPAFDLDDAQVQDMIVTESFEPVLDLFLAHPGWKVTIEMQAYLAEVLEQRHPQVLDKLLELQRNAQLELVSFHYSDQLFLAYPRHDMEVSHRLLDDVFQRLGLQASPVVFCQEGQFGEGMASFAAVHERSILLLAKNHFRYQHLSAYDSAAPLYRLGDSDIVVVGRSFATPQVEVRWSFFDDGELLATGGMAPYVPSGFVKDPAALAEYEQQLVADEEAGFRIAGIGDFVTWARENGLEQPQLPPMLDGTWQPPSTDSMRRWLGGSGVIDSVYHCERDNQVISGNVQARHWLLATETILAAAESAGKITAGQYRDELDECWRLALLGQVSDATGINPFINEVDYGREHAAAATDCADVIVSRMAPQLGGPYLEVDTAGGTVSAVDDLPASVIEPAEPVFTETQGFRVSAPGRQVTTEWFAGGAEGITRLVVTAGAASGGERTLEVDFPLALEGFLLTPGLLDDEVRFYPFTDFEFQEGRISLPLANGLLGLDQDLWLLKQTSSVHVAATFLVGDGLVRFIDDTVPAGEAVSWIFWFVSGAEQRALDFAGRINLTPTAYVQTGVEPTRGCGCASGSHGGVPPLLALLLLAGAGLLTRRT